MAPCQNACSHAFVCVVVLCVLFVGLVILDDGNSLQTLTLTGSSFADKLGGFVGDPESSWRQAINPAGQPDLGRSALGNPIKPSVPDGMTYCGAAYNESTAAGSPNVTKGRLSWSPRKDRFLVAFCQMGEFSNRVICHWKHMVISALLNRTLVWPSHDQSYESYDYRKTLDFPYLTKCLTPDNTSRLNNPVIISLEDYLRQTSSENLTIRCLQSDCGWRSTMYQRFENYGLTYHEEGDPNWDVKYKARVPLEAGYEYYSNFSNTRTLAIGDIYGIFIDATQSDQNTATEVIMGGWTTTGRSADSWNFLTWPEKGSNEDCAPLIRPHAAIMTAAKRFVRLFLGASPFFSVHMRHGDFLDYGGDMPSVIDFGHCLRVVIEAHPDIPVVFLSTNAAASEISLLSQLVQVPILTMNGAMLAPQTWNKVLENEYGVDWNTDTMILAMLEKAICSLSTIFLATARSTFS